MVEHVRTFLQVPNAALFALVYALSLLAVAGMNIYEFKRAPEKGKRYRLLPVRYKFACWFIVVPLFAGIVFEGALFIPAILAFMLLEAACVRWYRKSGLL